MQADFSKSTLPIETNIQALQSGLDPQRANVVLDELLSMVVEYDYLICTASPKVGLRIETRETVLCETKLDLIVPKFRSLCARLAVRCREWSGKEIALFGDEIEFEHPELKRRYRVCFKN